MSDIDHFELMAPFYQDCVIYQSSDLINDMPDLSVYITLLDADYGTGRAV